ncbi:MAG TPA: GNAT family N-acetyltransferase [Chloroflexota bacterium]|nr:GNAT family N-acetyltransferase [Chloroflexota bacterium]
MSEVHFRSGGSSNDAEALLRIHTMCDDCEPVDPVSPHVFRPTLAWFRERLSAIDPADLVIAEIDAQIAGYGQARWDWAESDGTHVFFHAGWVAPLWRGRGIGTGMLARLEAQCRGKAASVESARNEYATYTSEAQENAGRHLERNGYVRAFTAWEMELANDAPVAIEPLPAGYELRPITPDDHRAIWQSIGDAFDAACPGGRYITVPTEAAFRDSFSAAQFDPALCFVAWHGSRIAGQVICRIQPRCGEVAELSVGVGYQRRRLGSALLTRGIAALRERGVPTIRLGTNDANPSEAWRLYERVGFRRVGAYPRWRKGFSL